MEAGAAQQVANSIALHEELLGVAVKLAEEVRGRGFPGSPFAALLLHLFTSDLACFHPLQWVQC